MGMIKATEITLVSINKIKKHPKNNHKHSAEQIDRLSKIIEYQGFRTPITISNQTGYLITGHARLDAAKKLGINEMPVIYQDFDSEEQEYAHMTADNALTKDQWAEIDLSQINAELENIGPEFDLEMLGLKNFEIDLSNKNDIESQEKTIIFAHKIEIDCLNEHNQKHIKKEMENRGFKVRILI